MELVAKMFNKPADGAPHVTCPIVIVTGKELPLYSVKLVIFFFWGDYSIHLLTWPL